MFVRPLASGRGVTVPLECATLPLLLLNEVLYILAMDPRAATYWPPPIPLAIIVAPEYSVLGVIPLPWIALYY